MRRKGAPLPVEALVALWLLLLHAKPITCADNRTIFGLVQTDQELRTFKTLLDLTSMSDSALNDATAGPFTLLAPRDQAFDSVNGKYLEPAWKDYLEALVSYHVVIGDWNVSSRSRDNMTLPTAFLGKSVTLTENDPITFNDNAMVVNGNFQATNGRIHIVSAVLQPPDMSTDLMTQAASQPNLSRFVELATRLNLVPMIGRKGPYTLLIPTNDAIDKIPNSILNSLDDNALKQ
jgi:uncharacterized surface protein with fasciclin (FAS1) repeats